MYISRCVRELSLPNILRSVFVRHRELTLELARREIAERYAGSALGAVWAIFTPMVTMAIYVGLFAFVFPVRLGQDGSPWPGAVLILAGLVPWLACVDAMTRAPTVFTAQRSLVRQVVFPVEVLPARSVLVCTVPWCVGNIVMLTIACAAGSARATLLFLPVLWILQFAAMLGASYLLSTMGAWLRDLREVVAIATTVGLYAAPILLLPPTVASLPRIVQTAIALNPASHMVWCYHDVVVGGSIAHPISWIVFPLFACTLLATGCAVFLRARPTLAEAL